MGMGMGIGFANPMGMGMGMGMIFENGYGCGYSSTRPVPAPRPSLPTKLRMSSFRQGLLHSKTLSCLKVMARKSQQAPAGTVLDIRTV